MCVGDVVSTKKTEETERRENGKRREGKTERGEEGKEREREENMSNIPPHSSFSPPTSYSWASDSSCDTSSSITCKAPKRERSKRERRVRERVSKCACVSGFVCLTGVHVQ